MSEIFPKPIETKSQNWMEEVFEEYLGIRYRVKQSLFSQKSPFQTVDVLDTFGHGKMLFNDGLAMISERDEFIYHEMITHAPLFVHPCARRVLVIGGGDGGTAREVLRHSGVEKCVMVEIDGVVVEACKQHIPQTACVFENPRLELIIGDGVEYVKNCKEVFDVVIVDSTDPIGPAAPLFSTDFYQNVYNILADDGIVVSQGESPFYHQESQLSLLGILNPLFEKVRPYNFTNQTYPGGLWSFTFASKKYDPIEDFVPAKVADSGLNMNYYNSALHGAAFCLPQFQLKNIGHLIKA